MQSLYSAKFNILQTFYYKAKTTQIGERTFQCNDCGKDISDNSSDDVCFFAIMVLLVIHK